MRQFVGKIIAFDFFLCAFALCRVYRLFACFEESMKMVVEKNLRVMADIYKKQCIPIITWNKKYLSKQVVPITYTLEKRFFAVPTFLKVCELFLFRQSKKTCFVLLSTWVFFGFLWKKIANKYCLWKINLFFYMQIVSLMCQNLNNHEK